LIRSLAVVARDRTDGRFVRAAGFLKSRAGSEAVRPVPGLPRKVGAVRSMEDYL